MSFLKIGTRSRYALRFMIELAEVERAARSDETRRRGYVKLRTVASSQDISWRYLEQIAPALAEAGMVETGRGPLGGQVPAERHAPGSPRRSRHRSQAHRCAP